MSDRHSKSAEARDLLSLMTAADGQVIPHAQSAHMATIPPAEVSFGSDEVAAKQLADRRRARREKRKLAKAAKAPQRRQSAIAVSPQAPPAEELLSVKQVARRWNVGVATIWRWSANGTMPEVVRLGPGITRWRYSDIVAHEAAGQKRSDR